MQFVAIGTGVFSENQPVEDQYNYVMRPGMTSAIWTEYVGEVTKSYVNVFSFEPDQGLRKQLLLQFAPVFLSATERRYQSDFAASMGVGLSANLLMADYVGAYRSNGTGAYDPMYKWHQQVPMAFEGDAGDLCSSVPAYWAVVGSLAKHVDYLRMDEDLVQGADGGPTANVPIFAGAQQYVGRVGEEAPSVLVTSYVSTATRCRRVAGPVGVCCMHTAISCKLITASRISQAPSIPNWAISTFCFARWTAFRVDAPYRRPTTKAQIVVCGNPSRAVPCRKRGWATVRPTGTARRSSVRTIHVTISHTTRICRHWSARTPLTTVISTTSEIGRAKAARRGSLGARIAIRTGEEQPLHVLSDRYSYIDGSQTSSVALTVGTLTSAPINGSFGTIAGGEKAAIGPDGKNYIQKTGSKKLMEVTFSIPDGRFAGRLSGARISTLIVGRQGGVSMAMSGCTWSTSRDMMARRDRLGHLRLP